MPKNPLHIGHFKLISFLVKSSHFCKALAVKASYISRSIIGDWGLRAGGWGLGVSGLATPSHVNFSFILGSVESAQITRVLCSGTKCAAYGLGSTRLSPLESSHQTS